MKLIIVLVLTMLLAVTCAAQARPDLSEGKRVTEWSSIAGGDVVIDGRTGDLQVFVAPKTVKRNEAVVAAWLRFVMPNGSTFVVPGSNYGELRFAAVVQCTTVGRARASAMIAYDRAGQIVLAERYDEQSGPELAGSVGHAIYEYLCERGPASTTKPVLKPAQ